MSVSAPRSGAARRQFGGVKWREFQTISDLKGVKCKGLTLLLTYTPLRPGWSQSTVPRSSSSQLTWSSHSCSVSGRSHWPLSRLGCSLLVYEAFILTPSLFPPAAPLSGAEDLFLTGDTLDTDISPAGTYPPHQRFARRDENYLVSQPVVAEGG